MPGERDVALARHERACDSCRRFARSGSVLERRLCDALAIEVPASLSERIHRRRDFSERVRQRQVRPLRYALIGSLLLILGLALLLAYEFLAPKFPGIEVHQSIVQQSHDLIDPRRRMTWTYMTAARELPVASSQQNV